MRLWLLRLRLWRPSLHSPHPVLVFARALALGQRRAVVCVGQEPGRDGRQQLVEQKGAEEQDGVLCHSLKGGKESEGTGRRAKGQGGKERNGRGETMEVAVEPLKPLPVFFSRCPLLRLRAQELRQMFSLSGTG